jgi:hypothetical protein
MSNALADCAGELVVRPIPGSGLGVGGDVRRNNLAGQILKWNHLTRAVVRPIGSFPEGGPIVWRVAFHAPGHVLSKIFSAREALGSGLECPSSCRPNARPDKWTPANGEGNCDRDEQNNDEQKPTQNLSDLFHLFLMGVNLSSGTRAVQWDSEMKFWAISSRGEQSN